MPTATPRESEITRETNETRIALTLRLDPAPGEESQLATGVGFFDHMLDHLARHGRLAMRLRAEGDLQVDAHHTVEDVGIVIGQALHAALGDKRGVERYGFASVPMDETLVRATVDLSGRPAMIMDSDWATGRTIGDFDAELVREFWQAVVNHAMINLHVEVVRAGNLHHVAEATFKAAARALASAKRVTGEDVPSTKGTL